MESIGYFREHVPEGENLLAFVGDENYWLRKCSHCDKYILYNPSGVVFISRDQVLDIIVRTKSVQTLRELSGEQE